MSNLLDLSSVMACLAVSHKWRALASDNSVWRGLFAAEESRDGRGWSINLRRIQDLPLKFKLYHPPRRSAYMHARIRKHATQSETAVCGDRHSVQSIQRPFSLPPTSRHGPRSPGT